MIYLPFYWIWHIYQTTVLILIIQIDFRLYSLLLFSINIHSYQWTGHAAYIIDSVAIFLQRQIFDRIFDFLVIFNYLTFLYTVPLILNTRTFFHFVHLCSGSYLFAICKALPVPVVTNSFSFSIFIYYVFSLFSFLPLFALLYICLFPLDLLEPLKLLCIF